MELHSITCSEVTGAAAAEDLTLFWDTQVADMFQ